MVRWTILRILVQKEWQRLTKNLPAMLLLGMITAMALLLATSQSNTKKAQPPCWIVYWESSEWIESLEKRVPQNGSIRVYSIDEVPHRGDDVRYPAGVHSIQIRPPARELDEHARPQVWFLYAGSDPNAIWSYSQWFWTVTCEHFGQRDFSQRIAPIRGRISSLEPADLKDASFSELVAIETVGSLLLYMVLFFTCCHLLVSSTSQERERGTMLALALSPARLTELFAAKVLFHLALALSLSAVVVLIVRPAAIIQPVLWGTLVTASLGYIAIGLTICSLVRTQATAGLLTLSYMLFVGVTFYLAQEYSAIATLQRGMIEQYFFALAYINLKIPLGLVLPSSLIWLGSIGAMWLVVSGSVFVRRGWC